MKVAILAAVDALNAGGIPAVRAYPAQWQQEQTEPMATVSLLALAPESWKLLIHIFVPSALGGAACEDAALTAYPLLSSIGHVSIEGPCQYDAESDLFSIKLTVIPAAEE